MSTIESSCQFSSGNDIDIEDFYKKWKLSLQKIQNVIGEENEKCKF